MERRKVIGIIGAMESETAELKKKISIDETVKISGIEFLKGKLGETDVILAKCGVGKVFAAICAQTMIMKFAPDAILNIGVCGALDGRLDLCDVVLGEKTVQYDMDTSAVGDPVGLISGINKIYFECDTEIKNKIEEILKRNNINYLCGVVATGDRFFNSKELVESVKSRFSAISGDMESGAIAHACYINDVPFEVLRCITDKGDENSGEDYKRSLEPATRRLAEIVTALCNEK